MIVLNYELRSFIGLNLSFELPIIIFSSFVFVRPVPITYYLYYVYALLPLYMLQLRNILQYDVSNENPKQRVVLPTMDSQRTKRTVECLDK